MDHADETSEDAEAEIVSVPVHLAVTEILEYLEIFHFPKKTKKRLPGGSTNRLRVTVKTVGDKQEASQASSISHSWFQIKVKSARSRQSDFDILQFLQLHGTGLKQVVATTEELHKTCHLWYDQLGPDYRETEGKRNKESTTPESGRRTKVTINRTGDQIYPQLETESRSIKNHMWNHAITFQVFQALDHMQSQCEKVHDYMHKFKLLRPQVKFQFIIDISGSKFSTEFNFGYHNSTVGQRKVATNAQQYISTDKIPDNANKVVPRSGIVYSIPGFKVGMVRETLRINMIGFIVPSPQTEHMEIINHYCDDLKVLFYGPCDLPLMVEGVQQAGVMPSCLMQLQDYGLQFGTTCSPSHAHGPVSADWCYKLSQVESSSQSTRDYQDCTRQSYTIQLLVVIDHAKSCAKTAPHVVLDHIRQTFTHLLLTHRRKFRKAAASVLNKLLHNFSAKEQVGSSTEFGGTVCERLWQIAQEKFDLTLPNTTENITGRQSQLEEKRTLSRQDSSCYSDSLSSRKGSNLFSSQQLTVHSIETRKQTTGLTAGSSYIQASAKCDKPRRSQLAATCDVQAGRHRDMLQSTMDLTNSDRSLVQATMQSVNQDSIQTHDGSSCIDMTSNFSAAMSLNQQTARKTSDKMSMSSNGELFLPTNTQSTDWTKQQNNSCTSEWSTVDPSLFLTTLSDRTLNIAHSQQPDRKTTIRNQRDNLQNSSTSVQSCSENTCTIQNAEQLWTHGVFSKASLSTDALKSQEQSNSAVQVHVDSPDEFTNSSVLNASESFDELGDLDFLEEVMNMTHPENQLLPSSSTNITEDSAVTINPQVQQQLKKSTSTSMGDDWFDTLVWED